MTPVEPAALAVEFLFGLVGVVIGFLTSFAVFRSRFTAIEKDVENLKSDFKRELEYLRQEARKEWQYIREDVNRMCTQASAHDRTYQQRQERREIAMLSLLGDIAKGMRISNRFTDLQAYTEDDIPNPTKDR